MSLIILYTLTRHRGRIREFRDHPSTPSKKLYHKTYFGNGPLVVKHLQIITFRKKKNVAVYGVYGSTLKLT